MIRLTTTFFALVICGVIIVFVSRLSVSHTVFGSADIDTFTPPPFNPLDYEQTR